MNFGRNGAARMLNGTSHIQCENHHAFARRFAELDPFQRDNAAMIHEIETRFRAMARTYALQADHLRNWVGNGNQLPDVYR